MISTRVGAPAVSFARTGVLRFGAGSFVFRVFAAVGSGVTGSKRSARGPRDSTAGYNPAHVEVVHHLAWSRDVHPPDARRQARHSGPVGDHEPVLSRQLEEGRRPGSDARHARAFG